MLRLSTPAVAISLAAALWSSLAFATEPPSEFFEKQVRPIFVEHCQDCHGPEVAESKLRVDSLAGLLAGGERGPAIVPGKPGDSLLLSAINHDDVLQMPPKRKLPPKQIQVITKWIEAGAVWPGAVAEAALPPRPATAGFSIRAEDRRFWSFQRPQATELPVVRDATFARGPIDCFLLAALEAKQLRPARETERRVLIRRATFDLTGLPPIPDDVEQFVGEAAPDAYERLLDRLLASPHYGERWGRHWLDVARYADSKGMDENLAFINAYRYRDYVIRAFNGDKPYDQFVLEQLAGDLLPRAGEEDSAHFERLTATGFLSIGPKMLADDDPKKKEMDIIDEQLDTLGKAFLGLTLGCARCHDHKFDPISTADYYALAGILKSTHTMDDFGVVANWHECQLETKEQTAQRLAFEEQLKALNTRLGNEKNKVYTQAVERERSRTGEYVLAAAQLVHFAPGATRPKATIKADEVAKQRGLEATLLRQWVAYLNRKREPKDPIWQPFIELEETGSPPEAWADAAKRFQTEADRARKGWQEALAASEGRARQLDDAQLEALSSAAVRRGGAVQDAELVQHHLAGRRICRAGHG